FCSRSDLSRSPLTEKVRVPKDEAARPLKEVALMSLLSDVTQTAASIRPDPDKLSHGSVRQERAQAAITKKFAWGAGSECSFIPHLNVDQFDWTQHNRFWPEDFKLAREKLGIQTLRYALPWHKLELEPGKFVWDLADERINAAKELGIELYLDVM